MKTDYIITETHKVNSKDERKIIISEKLAEIIKSEMVKKSG
jgi:hypothetical protein